MIINDFVCPLFCLFCLSCLACDTGWPLAFFLLSRYIHTAYLLVLYSFQLTYIPLHNTTHTLFVSESHWDIFFSLFDQVTLFSFFKLLCHLL